MSSVNSHGESAWSSFPTDIVSLVAKDFTSRDHAAFRRVSKEWREAHARAGFLDSAVAAKIDGHVKHFRPERVFLRDAFDAFECTCRSTKFFWFGGAGHLFQKAEDAERHPAMRVLFKTGAMLGLVAGLSIPLPIHFFLAAVFESTLLKHYGRPQTVAKRERHAQRRIMRSRIQVLSTRLQPLAPSLGPKSWASLQRAVQMLEAEPIAALKLRHPTRPVQALMDAMKGSTG